MYMMYKRIINMKEWKLVSLNSKHKGIKEWLANQAMSHFTVESESGFDIILFPQEFWAIALGKEDIWSYFCERIRGGSRMEQMADTHKSFLMGWQSAKTRVRSLWVQQKNNIARIPTRFLNKYKEGNVLHFCWLSSQLIWMQLDKCTDILDNSY